MGEYKTPIKVGKTWPIGVDEESTFVLRFEVDLNVFVEGGGHDSQAELVFEYDFESGEILEVKPEIWEVKIMEIYPYHWEKKRCGRGVLQDEYDEEILIYEEGSVVTDKHGLADKFTDEDFITLVDAVLTLLKTGEYDKPEEERD